MAKYLVDCPSVVEKIEDGTLGKRELSTIVDKYNECIEAKGSDRSNRVVVQQKPAKETSSWNSLEEKLKSHEDFEGRTNAVEMVAEIKNKIRHGEKIPNFLTDGLKSTLAPTDLKGDLDKALLDLN